MRSRLLLAIATLGLMGSELDAQTRVRPPFEKRRPDQPAEKPPLVPGLTDPASYSRYRLSRFSLEQYPMLSHMSLTNFVSPGATNAYWTFGDGTHLGFRATPSLFLTADFTSAAIGGPFAMGTSDIGVRIKPWTSPRFTPFADARVSWAYTTGNGYNGAAIPLYLMVRSFEQDFTQGRGTGTLLGIGVDTRVRARWSVTTSLASTRYAMHARDMRSLREWDYTATTTRLIVGLKYHHGSWIDAR
jgi:hypothetical protein